MTETSTRPETKLVLLSMARSWIEMGKLLARRPTLGKEVMYHKAHHELINWRTDQRICIAVDVVEIIVFGNTV